MGPRTSSVSCTGCCWTSSVRPVRSTGPTRVGGQHQRPGGQRGDLTGPNPVDRGKPGSKIHAMTDRGGIPLTVLITAANTNDHLVLQRVVDSVTPVRGPAGRPRKRPAKLHGDKGYDYHTCRKASSPPPFSGGTATSSNAPWNGSPGSGGWPAATTVSAHTSKPSYSWPAPSSATAEPSAPASYSTTPTEMRSNTATALACRRELIRVDQM
jgi:hypothetical protein